MLSSTHVSGPLAPVRNLIGISDLLKILQIKVLMCLFNPNFYVKNIYWRKYDKISQLHRLKRQKCPASVTREFVKILSDTWTVGCQGFVWTFFVAVNFRVWWGIHVSKLLLYVKVLSMIFSCLLLFLFFSYLLDC